MPISSRGSLVWIGYLSSAGVYGDCSGERIDVTRARDNQHRLDAAEVWLALGERAAIPVHLFQLPGIYGPHGRSAIDSLESGRTRRIVKPGQVFNRIYVDDLAAVLRASMAIGRACGRWRGRSRGNA